MPADRNTREPLIAFGSIVTICQSCNEVGIVREVGGKCWVCGGCVGHEYPTRLAFLVSDILACRIGSLS